jgi:hypothetical protein
MFHSIYFTSIPGEKSFLKNDMRRKKRRKICHCEAQKLAAARFVCAGRDARLRPESISSLAATPQGAWTTL